MCVCVCVAVGTGQPSLFGNNQSKLGATLGTMGSFGATAFNTGASSLGFGAPQQPIGEQRLVCQGPPLSVFIDYI